jgi:cytochrome c
MTFDQKRAYMKTAVVPTMKPIFQAFDAKKFKKVDCVTCHGEDGADASSRCRAMTSTRCRTRRKASRPS